MKYFIFLYFLASASEITIQSVLVAGLQSNSFEERPLTKVNNFHGDSTDGIIILAALRSNGGNFRGKYKKVIELTTVKVTTEEVVKVTTTTTEGVLEASTERVFKLATKEVTKDETVKVNDQKSKLNSKVRRNEVTTNNIQNPLWISRKRITRPPKSVPTKKIIKVNVVDEEDFSIRRARYLFSQRSGKK